MKSIKEKAEDIQLGYDDIQAPAIGRGFVLGANYVLEQIESLTKYNRWSAQDLYNLIEKLKGNK